MKLRLPTIAWLLVAGASVVAVSADPRGRHLTQRPESATQRPQDRVFPEWSERQRRSASLEFVGPKGPVIRLIPGTHGGHELFVDGQIWGPASEEAVQNAWSNLRMARVIRGLGDNTSTEVGRWGAISLHIGDRSLALRLGKSAPDGAGVYAQREGQANAELVDGELMTLVESPAELWLRRAMLAVDVAQVARLEWARASELSRGADGRWRVRLSSQEQRLLNSSAVDLKLARLLHAPLRTLVNRTPTQVRSLRPWITVVDAQGMAQHVMAGGPCPGEPGLRLVDRGPGRLGCIDSELLEPWAFVHEGGVGLLEVKLVPHRYGEWSGVDQSQAQALELRRRPGRWEMAMGQQNDRFSVVSESEVYRWYRRLGELYLDFGQETLTPEEQKAIGLRWQARLHFDGGQSMQLSCGQLVRNEEKLALCRRDEGPWYFVKGTPIDQLELSFEALADRQILEFSSGSVRAVEIVDGRGTEAVRQAAHLDYGEWKLSQPDHPDASGALDQIRLEALLAALGDLRASAWVEDAPAQKAQRTIELDFVPGLESKQGNKIELFEDCAIRVLREGEPGKTARLDSGRCRELFGGILYDDPLATLLRNASSVEVELFGPGQQIRRRRLIAKDGPGQGWSAIDLSPRQEQRLLARLRYWNQRRSLSLASGRPTSPIKFRLHIQRESAPPVTVELGEGWAQIQGRSWYFITDKPVRSAKR